MRLIAMKFRGFGPYKGEYAIDFAALTRSRMFLIDGETGAGKTTILDCLTFALYGNISGNEKDTLDAGGDGQRVRSRFLTGERTETYVDLIFRSGDDYYEVRRTPKYDQPKTRGDGFTPHNATGKLMRIDCGIAALAEAPGNDPERYFAYAEEAGHAEAITSRAGDVRPEITRIIGLDREQFSRTIMLAQGQFAMFLSLNPEKRTELVEDLFGATIYEDIQTELAERRKSMRADVEKEGIRLVGGIATAKATAARILEQQGATEKDGIQLEDGGGPENKLDILSNVRWGLDREDAGRLAYPAREPDEIRHSLRDVVVGVDAECDALVRDGETRDTQARRALDLARARQTDAETLRDAAARELRDIQALHDVQADDSAIERSRHDLARAIEAQPILDLDREAGALQVEQQRLAEQNATLRRQLDQLTDRNDLERRREQALQTAAGAEAARADLERADTHEQLVAAAERAATQHEQAKQELDRARAATEQAQQASDELPDPENVERELQEIAEQLGGEQGLHAQLDQAKRILGHARQVERLTEETPALERRRDEAEAAHHAAERTLQSAEDAIRRAGAARYAATLEDGEPCPVCGSTDHPHPAVMPDDAADAQEIAELKRRVADKQAAAEQARTALREAERDLDSHREHSEGLDVEQAEKRITELETAVDALDMARARRDELRDIRKTIAAATQAAQQARTALAAAEAKETETGNAANTAAEHAEGHTKTSVAEERAAARARLDEARAQEREAARLKRAIDERDELERRHTQAQAQADAAARNAGEAQTKRDHALKGSAHFTTIDEAAAAGLDERERVDLQQRIRRHEDALHTATANLARSRNELKEALAGIGEDGIRELGVIASAATAYTEAGEPTPLGEAITSIDTDALAAAVQEAERHAAETGRRVGALTTLRQDWRTQAERMERAAGQWARRTARFAPLERMAALANGDKSASGAANRLTLITYAVTERFRDVLDRANELLGDIQGGIYELRLVDDAIATGNRKTGLDITVFDRRTEQTRNPGTLSGGETFFVSLALALALADIIQAENGGISMDTLFVDEGFGTLSQDYLADVMDMLRRISRTRDVGIISHVDWLKDQIAERISVSRVAPDGESRLEVIA